MEIKKVYVSSSGLQFEHQEDAARNDEMRALFVSRASINQRIDQLKAECPHRVLVGKTPMQRVRTVDSPHGGKCGEIYYDICSNCSVCGASVTEDGSTGEITIW